MFDKVLNESIKKAQTFEKLIATPKQNNKIPTKTNIFNAFANNCPCKSGKVSSGIKMGSEIAKD